MDLNTPKVKERHRQKFITYVEGKKEEKGKDYWAKKWWSLVQDMEFVLAEDLRFLEECQIVVQNGGVIYKVHAEPEVRKQRGWIPDPAIDNHYSVNYYELSGKN